MNTHQPPDTKDHGRPLILKALEAELVGPEPLGMPLSLNPAPSFATWKDANGPWHDLETGEEILTRDGPAQRYGVGVLYPPETQASDVAINPSGQGDDGRPSISDEIEEEASVNVDVHTTRGFRTGEDGDDFDLTATNQYRPSAMAISFLAELPAGSQLHAHTDCGRYDRVRVVVEGGERTWWVRRRVSINASWTSDSLDTEHDRSVPPTETTSSDLGPIVAEFQAYSRSRPDGSRLITIALINRTLGVAEASLYQVGFTITLSKGGRILPYPEHQSADLLASDPEERSMRLLYRNTPTFGIGHGCAATWNQPRHTSYINSIEATALPAVETPSVTPQILLDDGTDLAVRMPALAGLDETDDGFSTCARVVTAYKDWIGQRRLELVGLIGSDRQAAEEHLMACITMADRMTSGLEWLSTDPAARRAFQLANQAVLDQQLRGGTKLRTTTIKRDGSYEVMGTPPEPDWRTTTGRGTWRPFQIGFLLASAQSTALGDDPCRDVVDLIFFPTGGGKTEAYLGLSAFSLFHQRLTGNDPAGVGVLMRYTMRLLTTQQFLRASTLICAMESIRSQEVDLGSEPFSIGIWVGGSATPNKRTEAKRALSSLNKKANERNPFLVLQCPWCAAGMGPASPDGPVRWTAGRSRTVARTAGYTERRGTVHFRCPDSRCAFSKENNLLPIHVVDEDVYEHTPSIVIGTVDKFASVAWTPEARSLFGIRSDGERGWTPPNLIIQDELHLISGPLGSMAGLYETLIEDLCTDKRFFPPRKPKIVCSTATIRQFRRQVKDLYNRDQAALFPPLGLDASDSFFATYARDAAGDLLPGRMYVGVYAPGLGSGQTTIVRTLSSLLQGAKTMDTELADPWWTVMCFFNSLRELGITMSLVQSDIPDYLKAVRNRGNIGPDEARWLTVVKELTSRLREDEIPAAIQELERQSTDNWPVDVCLASSMIEVGIDIPRLSLMCVVGQPKTTSQYIQVTGRIGREWRDRPGLVVTVYGATKPRDRSHFERFTTYHNQLYAQVEPVSITPFAKPVVKRAAHGVIAGYVRQNGPDDLRPWPYPNDLVLEARTVVEARAGDVDSEELGYVKGMLDQREREWRQWERLDWDAKQTSGINPAPLLRSAGQWYPTDVCRVSWATPTSLRDVDAECSGSITQLYANPPGEP